MPPGWSTAVVGDLGVPNEQAVMTGPFGSHMRSSEFSSTGVPVLTIGCLTEAGISLEKASYLPEKKAEPLVRYRLRQGDMLFSRMASVGRAGFVTAELEGTLFNYHLMRLRLDGSVYHPQLFLAFVRGAPQVPAYLDEVNHGATRDGINTEQLLGMPVLVPPVNEQRRIVAKLEVVLEQTRAAKARFERLPAMLANLQRSILAAAFRGDLTKDWRAGRPNAEPASALLDRIRAERRRRWEDGLRAKGKNTTRATYEGPAAIDTEGLSDLPPGWTWAAAGELIDRVESGRSPKAHGRPAGAGEQGVLKVSAVSWGRFLPDENKALMSGDIAEPELLVRRGDLLISRANTVELVGAVVLVNDEFPHLMLSDKTLRLVPSANVDREFLLHAFRTHPVRKTFEEDATGTSDSMRNLSQDKIRAAPIAVAPLDEQREIARLLRAALAIVDALAIRVEQAEARCRVLEQAALAKAFRGELVPQDSSDEPASVLLERIRAARASEPERHGRGRTSRQVDPAVVDAGPNLSDTRENGSAAPDQPLDLVVATFHAGKHRLTAADIIETTGLRAAQARNALKALVDAGQVRIERKGREPTYVWNS